MDDHFNTRYEYTTREFSSNVFTPDWEADMEREGWRRVWGDITMDGTFAVYRRERREWIRPSARDSG
jgi:hypothetical protein